MKRCEFCGESVDPESAQKCSICGKVFGPNCKGHPKGDPCGEVPTTIIRIENEAVVMSDDLEKPKGCGRHYCKDCRSPAIEAIVKEGPAKGHKTYSFSAYYCKNCHNMGSVEVRGEKILVDTLVARSKGQRVLIPALFLNEKEIRDISDIKGLDRLSYLTCLLLHDNQITEIKGLDSFTDLHLLVLEGNQITKIKGLDKLKSLKDLILNKNRINRIEGLETLTNLRNLELSGNQISVIEGLESLSSLQKIDLSGNPIKSVNLRILLPNLQIEGEDQIKRIYEEWIQKRQAKGDAKDIEAIFKKGLNLRVDGKLDAAFKVFQEIIKIDPKNDMVLFEMGVITSRLGKTIEAIKYYDKAISLNPKNAPALGNKGILLADLGQVEESLRYHEMSLQVDPNSAIEWTNKGAILSRLNRVEESILCFDKAISLNREFYFAWFLKGTNLFKLGDLKKSSKYYEEALKCYENTLTIKPDFSDAYIMKEDILDKLLNIDRNNIELLKKKAETLRSMRKYNEELNCLAEILKIEPNNKEAKNRQTALYEYFRTKLLYGNGI